jgi:cytochrome c-type biogenesis protein
MVPGAWSWFPWNRALGLGLCHDVTAIDFATLSEHPGLALPVLFAGGVLTSLTPCIYPMIPVTAAIVGGQTTGQGVPRRRVVGLTAAYVFGLSLVYALLGLAAGLSGTLFGAVSSNPWMSFVVANVLVASALMMLDVLPVPIPRWLITRAAALQGRGRYAGTFGMGATSGLVAAPCGAPVMGAVLGWVATTHSATLGFLYLFAFSLGMCTLLVAVGLTAGALVRLPRAGVWMLWVKRGFALIMLGVAEYYLITMGALLL